MILYVNGQDIRRLVLGDVAEQSVQIIETEPERFLQVIDTFLKNADQDWKDLQAIYAVIGPGSATALRSILSILQTVHFVQGTVLFALEKSPEEDDRVTLTRAETEAEAVSTLIPLYQHSPQITISNKDALGRVADSTTQ